MIKTATDKLLATVVNVTDLGRLFPAPAFKGRIGLDVRLERGSLSTGKRVLSGLAAEEEVEIVGVEMLSNPDDPHVVRIIFFNPKHYPFRTGR